MMLTLIRPEEPRDYRAVEELTREAFFNLHEPGCCEHLIVHKLRGSDAFLPALSFVAEQEGRVAGHIAYSRSRVAAKDATSYAAISFGPVSVLPALQGRGIGSALIRHSLDAARSQGHGAVIIYGNPDYYGRFGFVCGKAYGIRRADGAFAPALMCLEFSPGALAGVCGRFHEDPVFAVSAEELAAFDAGFPPREKLTAPSQEAFERLARLTLPD